MSFSNGVRRRCHWEGESKFLLGDGDKSICFIGEDECVSQISWGGGLSCICAAVIKICWTYSLSKACIPLNENLFCLDVAYGLLRIIFPSSPIVSAAMINASHL